MAPPIQSVGTSPLVRRGGKLTLNLGVLVQPYRANGRKVSGLTTADVAGFLEQNYSLMSVFYRVHQQDIVHAFENSLQGAFESLLQKRAVDPWGAAMQDTMQLFRDFISSREAERVGIPGTPTKAAQRGVNHRLKRPYRKRNPSRPSFRDTGLYMNSFRAWME